MPILLVKVNTNSVPDSPGRWKAGEVVAAVADSHEFGAAEAPSAGNFYHVTVTNRTLEQVESYLQGYRHEPTTAITASNGTGGFRITITSTMVSASGKNAITRTQMDNFITKWNGVYVSHTNTTYTFDITAFGAATSEGLFDASTSGIVFVDEGFSAGVQQAGVTNTGTYTPAQIKNAVEAHGGTVIDSNSFTIPSATLYEEFKDDIEDGWRNISFARRRWYINAAGMAFLAGNGGVASGTAAQISSYLRDGLLD